MTDFQERIVKKKFDTEDLLISIAIVLVAVIISLVSSMMQTFIYYNFIIWFVIIVATVMLIKRRFIEWEYSLYASEMNVSKIYSKSKRKLICNVNFESAQVFGPLSTYDKHKDSVDKEYICVSSMSNEDSIYYLIFRQSNLSCVLFFEPDEKMVAMLKERLPRKYDNQA